MTAIMHAYGVLFILNIMQPNVNFGYPASDLFPVLGIIKSLLKFPQETKNVSLIKGK